MGLAVAELLLLQDQKRKQRLLAWGRRGSCRAALLMRGPHSGLPPATAKPKGGRQKLTPDHTLPAALHSPNGVGSSLPAPCQRIGHESPLVSLFSSASWGVEYSEKGFGYPLSFLSAKRLCHAFRSFYSVYLLF